MDLNKEIDYAILRSFMYSNASPKEVMEIVKGNKNLRGGELHQGKCRHFKIISGRIT